VWYTGPACTLSWNRSGKSALKKEQCEQFESNDSENQVTDKGGGAEHSPQKRRKDGTLVGYSGGAAPRREQYCIFAQCRILKPLEENFDKEWICNQRPLLGKSSLAVTWSYQQTRTQQWSDCWKRCFLRGSCRDVISSTSYELELVEGWLLS
jgi:hypothetical protein